MLDLVHNCSYKSLYTARNNLKNDLHYTTRKASIVKKRILPSLL